MLKATRTFIYLINDQGIFKNNVDLQDFFLCDANMIKTVQSTSFSN